MSEQANLISIGYFGKVPTRGDFIKATDNANLIGLVDSWLTRAMELLSAEPRWKSIYDSVAPMHFAVAATRTQRAVAGHLRASRDQADRRFPFISLGALQITQPADFLPYCPLILGRLWNRLEIQTSQVMQAEDASESLQQLCTNDVLLDIGAQSYHGVFDDFLDGHTLNALREMLMQGGYDGDLRRLIMALGLLLHPVMASGASRLDKSLVLPLPRDLQQRDYVAALWMHFISPFLFKADFELALIITRLGERHIMIVGFDGASPRTLQAVMDPPAGHGHHIGFDDTDWVENAIAADYRLERLSSYLAQPALQLGTALSHFREIFLG
jgi:type VI secretion system protein ImpM